MELLLQVQAKELHIMIIGNSSQFASISFRKRPLQQTVTNRWCISNEDQYSWINLWLISSRLVISSEYVVAQQKCFLIFTSVWQNTYIIMLHSAQLALLLFHCFLCSTLFVIKEGFGWLLNILLDHSTFICFVCTYEVLESHVENDLTH